MTSAPKSERIVAAAGAAMKLPQSITFKPSNKSPISFLPLIALRIGPDNTIAAYVICLP
jgi:hypothetical protein